MLIMLRTNWPADTFRRAGIAFQRGIPVDCDDAAVKRLAGDLGKSLVIVNATNAKADHDATAECAADVESFLKKSVATSCQLVDPPAGNSAAEPASAAEAQTTTMVEPPPPLVEHKRKR